MHIPETIFTVRGNICKMNIPYIPSKPPFSVYEKGTHNFLCRPNPAYTTMNDKPSKSQLLPCGLVDFSKSHTYELAKMLGLQHSNVTDVLQKRQVKLLCKMQYVKEQGSIHPAYIESAVAEIYDLSLMISLTPRSDHSLLHDSVYGNQLWALTTLSCSETSYNCRSETAISAVSVKRCVAYQVKFNFSR